MLWRSARIARIAAVALVLAFMCVPAAAFAVVGNDADDAVTSRVDVSDTPYATPNSAADTNASSPQEADEDYVVGSVIELAESTASALYTETLNPPIDRIASTNVMPSASILLGSGGNIYYLRETDASGDGTGYAFNTLEAYDVSLETWGTLASMPVWLTFCSGALWEGNLIVCGVGFDASAKQPTAQEYVYLYSPERNAWATLSAEGVPLGASIVYDGNALLVVGGATGSVGLGTTVYEYNIDTGLGEQVATLEIPVVNPQLAAHKGDIYVYSYGDSMSEWSGGAAAQHLQVVGKDAVTVIDDALPDIKAGDAGANVRSQLFGSLAGVVEGLMLVGPTSEDDSFDTYIMEWGTESVFMPYDRRASNSQLYAASACVYDDKLYAAASSLVEANNAVFRATDVIGVLVQTGNFAVWRRGSDAVLPMTYSPDLSRFSQRVTVDNVELKRNSDYTATQGSTIVNLAPEYLQKIDLGQHQMQAYFDGGGVIISSYFLVEEEAAPLADSGTSEGRTTPTALARTGDVWLAVPFALVGIAAIGLGIHLLRRKSRII